MLTQTESARRIQEGAATVCSVSDHFDVLRLRVLDLLQHVHASERGFFTPTEDEQTRHLQVSFWQSRNALFELVSSIHRVDVLPPQHHPAALLVAYAGALVLVDAARFLREQFHDRPVVRSKLNEAEPHFRIPAGIYDRLQKSLTSPVHAWHLYHAGRYLADHRSEVSELAAEWPELHRVETVAERLQERLRVSPTDYVIARIRSRGTSVRRRGLGLLTRAVYGLQKSASQFVSAYYVRPGHTPALPADVHRQLAALLQPGDVLVTRKEYALTNYFLPGYWPHAALYLGAVEDLERMELHRHEHLQTRWERLVSCDQQSSQRVLEALKDGIRFRSVNCPLGSDAVAIVRPELTLDEIRAALARGIFHEGKPYDFDFDFTRSDRLVCTEVVYRSFEGIGGITFPLTRRAGRLTLSAEDLLHRALARDHFRIVAVYCPGRSPIVERDEQAEDSIRHTATRPGC